MIYDDKRKSFKTPVKMLKKKNTNERLNEWVNDI